MSPGYVFLASFVLSVFGIAFKNAVLLSTIAGFISIASAASLADSAGRVDGQPRWYGAAAVSVSLLGSYIFFAHQRVPVGDMEAIGLASVAGACLGAVQIIDVAKHRTRFYLAALVGGLGIGLAPFIKLHAVVFSVGALMAWVASYGLFDDEWRRRWRAATPYVVIGLMAAFAVWIGWAAWMVSNGYGNRIWTEFGLLRAFSPFTRPQRSALSKEAFTAARFFNSNIFYRHPVETLLATLSFFSLAFSNRRNWPLLLACGWLLSGVVIITILSVDPMRYRLLVWPPLVVLAAHFWTDLMSMQHRFATGWRRWIVLTGCGVVFGLIGIYYVVGRNQGHLGWATHLLIVGGMIAATYAVCLIIDLIRPKNAAFVLACALVMFSIPQWVTGERSVSHDLLDASVRLEKYPDAVVCGGWAVRIGFSTSRKIFYSCEPEGGDRPTLRVSETREMKDLAPVWIEFDRHVMHRVPLSLSFYRPKSASR